jgi:phosphoribosylformylglycinamidine cyclo-ligase|tara:strand:+ start:83 stop:979 length:897 start_codon:yes stop_codon:yes gene_type:complete
MNYKDSGVDIEAGNAFVDELKKKAPSIGGFGGMFEVPRGYEEPVLVSGTDGVGTKINMAQVFGDYTTIGQDLVAMCVNDVITCGAKPLYFLDYVSCVKLDARIADIMVGILKGCELAGVELIGGETAEHGRFAKDLDLAGFCTGVVEKNEIIDGSLIRSGDKIIGLPSSGVHSNGYSLINDMLWRQKIYYRDLPELLTPTKIYSSLIQELLNEIPIVGMAHITGGGLEENVNRIIPKGLKVRIDYNSWRMPEIFSKIMLAGEIPEEEMKRVFNLGIGYVLIVPPEIDYGIQIGEVYAP